MNGTSIVVVNWNTRDLTIRCVESVLALTPEPHEIVLVDNGSTDGSLDAFSRFPKDRVRVLPLPKNLGFAGGNNRGIDAASGDSICLLNSDTRVTRNWLGRLQRELRKHEVGLAGPMTDHARGRQRRRPWFGRLPPPFRRGGEVEYLSFFCVLIRKAVFERIGTLDERFGLGTFEDDDFCLRARAAGFRLRIAARSWVWHDAHGTFRANRLDDRLLQEENRALFQEKWKPPSE